MSEFPPNPYGNMDIGKAIHDASVFPHGRADPYVDSSPTAEEIREAQANCPYCHDWVRYYARKELDRLRNDRPEASEND